MFDSFFKRSGASAAPEQASANTQKPDQRVEAMQARQAALARSEAFDGDEAAAAEFVLQCEFADARLKAAHYIHAKPVLEQVAQAMRNTDRRVAKLMQQRLDAILQRDAREQKADGCVKQAQRMADEPQLMLNQVADLDRAWQSIGDVSETMQNLFDRYRSVLHERVQAQTALQRAVIDVRARMQRLMQTAANAQPQLVSPEEAAQTLNALELEMAQHCAAREAASLPKNLVSEFTRDRHNLLQMLASIEKRRAAIVAREAVLAGWEAAPVSTLREDDLKQAWKALPAPHEDDTIAFNARFEVLIDRISQSRKSAEAVVREGQQDNQGNFTEALECMEKALSDGELHAAAEHDKTVRSIDVKTVRLSKAQTARLALARSELSRLQGWAKWGGNVSREELLKAADELAGQQHAVPELAKKVGSLREHWKSLDISAGPAGKELRERFDAACTTAYAPAAAHFKKLADERQHNLAKAQSILAEVRQFAGTPDCASPDSATEVDWKAIANYCVRMTQLWQRLGPIDRKAKKSIDAEFTAAMRILSEPLAHQQQTEIACREKMIAEAAGLRPTDRAALDTLRALQAHWQERAKSLPLQRSDEQALWRRFRAACDAAFAKRKEAAKAADADRQQHLQAKEALCATLEGTGDAPHAALAKILREAREAWNLSGPVPRAAEKQIEARYLLAIAALQKRLDGAQRSASRARFDALQDKLALCHALEERIAGRQPMDDTEPARREDNWNAVPALSPEFERILRARFDHAIEALKSADRQYASALEQNRAALGKDVLRLEILMGIDSPPELTRERLQLQVEVLQSSLKSGQKPVTQDTHLLQLCALPALTDRQTGNRIAQILARYESSKV